LTRATTLLVRVLDENGPPTAVRVYLTQSRKSCRDRGHAVMPDCAVRADQHLASENVGPCWSVISTRQSGRHSFTTFDTITVCRKRSWAEYSAPRS